MNRPSAVTVLSALVAFVFVSITQPAVAASTRFDFVRDEIGAIKRMLDMPSGIAVAVVEGDRLVFEDYQGFSDVENEVPVDDATHFYIASTTKAFLALATLVAEQRGDISRYATLRDLFPDIAFESSGPRSATVRQLLTHSSGLEHPAFTWAASWSGQHDEALRHRFVASLQRKHAPGTFEYSNLGYNVMSVWFDRHYGRDWRESLDQFVLAPLGMEQTSGFISEVERNHWAFAKPYSYKHADGKKQIYLRKDDSTMYSIGLVSTARDVAKFLAAQLNDGRVMGRQVFPAELIRQSQARQVDVESYFDGYAWGWQLGRVGEEREIFHTGGFPGASALISFLPGRDIGVVVLLNESGLRANNLASIVKNMVYAAHAGTAIDRIREEAQDAAGQLVERVAQAQAELIAERDRLSAAEWSLGAERSDYGGLYENALAGRILVRAMADGSFRFEWGNLEGEAYAREERDAMLVEFRPGDYVAVDFTLVDGEVKSLSANGYEFQKRPEGFAGH